MSTEKQKKAVIIAEAAQYMSQNCDTFEVTPEVVSHLIATFSGSGEISTETLAECLPTLQEEVDKLV